MRESLPTLGGRTLLLVVLGLSGCQSAYYVNARAVASLKGELSQVEREVAGLVQQMQRSIDESNAFIEQLGTA